mmetsp:Transcript_84588/g.213346  ORF Transcript_84588/g.213346 Transcript_84588/m.213346 type:complete len:370 (+) Transcript_84588:117-1226(+)
MAAATEGTIEVKMEEGLAPEAVGAKPSSRASIVVEHAVTDRAHDELEKKKDVLKAHQQHGTLEARTVSDAVTGGGKASNPDAADQLGLDILAGFRRKVFAILLLQCAVIWGLAAGIARIPFIKDRNMLDYSKEKREFYMDCGIAGGVFVLSVISLAVVSRYRYRWSRSLIALSIFTVIISTFLGIVCGPNILLGLALALGGTFLVALPTCVRFKDRMIEVFPVAMLVAVSMLIIGFGGWLTVTPHIEARWAAPCLLLNAVGMMWLGYEMDWICSRLNPDEYLLPICLVWSEILTTVVVVTVMVMASDYSSCQPGDCLSGCGTYCHCDCWLYANGDSSKKQHFRNMNKIKEAEGRTAPAQQSMQEETMAP